MAFTENHPLRERFEEGCPDAQGKFSYSLDVHMK
jgi:hypothetical protein